MKTLAIISSVLAITVAVPALSACAPIAPVSYPALAGPDVDSLQPGVTTLREAIIEMGASASISDMGGGEKLYQWMFDIYRYGSQRAVHVAILFNKAGVMVRIDHKAEIPY